MRGSVDWQVREIFQKSGIQQIGESKHEAKAEARENGAATWAEVGKAVGCYSFSQLDDYRAISKQAFNAIREEYGTKDILKIEAAQIQGWMADKIMSGDIARSTSNTYHAALEKLEQALNKYCVTQDIGKTFNFDLKETRALAIQVLGDKNDNSRAYQDPKGLIDALKNEDFKLVASIQLEGGARINEAARIHEHQLRGLKADPHTGEIKGYYERPGKGGKICEVGMKKETYEKLVRTIELKGKTTIDRLCGMYKNETGQMKGWVQKTGSAAPSAVSVKTYMKIEKHFMPGSRCFEVNKKTYNAALKTASVKTGQKYNASHGLRWSFAQARHNELQMKCGMTYEQSLSIVAQELDHNRSDISCHYLK